MNKIGIIVSRVSSGAEILFSSEAAKQWQNEALDTRNYLKCIDIEKNQKISLIPLFSISLHSERMLLLYAQINIFLEETVI